MRQTVESWWVRRTWAEDAGWTGTVEGGGAWHGQGHFRCSSLRVRRKERGCGSDCGDDGAADETEVSRDMHRKGSWNQAARNLLIWAPRVVASRSKARGRKVSSFWGKLESTCTGELMADLVIYMFHLCSGVACKGIKRIRRLGMN